MSFEFIEVLVVLICNIHKRRLWLFVYSEVSNTGIL